jgi:beta-phosphoglucomutase
MIRAVLFDLDGVLIDAKEWHYAALNKALAYFGMEINRFDHVTTFDGFPTRKKLEFLTRDKHLPRSLHPLIQKLKQANTHSEIIQKCKPAFHHQYLMSRLKKEGYALAVVSNSVRETIELTLRRAQLLPYLEFYLSCEEVMQSKPDPEIYHAAIARLKLKPEECLVVEDHPVGVEAAQRAHAHVLEVGTTDDVTYDTVMGKINAIHANTAS